MAAPARTASRRTRPATCTFDVTPNPVAAVPTQVTITGTAPTTDNTHVVLFVDGVPATPNSGPTSVETDPAPTVPTRCCTRSRRPADGSGLPLSVNFTFGNQNAYSAVCTGPGGITVIRVKVQTSPAEVVDAACRRPRRHWRSPVRPTLRRTC